jgi:tetratricopeptide (TPR) repeat protein
VLAGAAAVQAQRVMFARDGSGSELAREAVALCLRAARASGDEREALLDRGLAVAERAVAASDRDAKAHFAVFCNLGRKLEDEGASLANVARLGRLRAAIDRALALEPAFVDALAAKGAMLVRLPAILGGDDDEGEHLIRRAVELAPDHPPARLELAKALAEKGEEDEALTEARTVIALAGGTEAVEASEARELERRLGS